MHRLLILISILPIITIVICRKFFSDRLLRQSEETQLQHNAQELARKMLVSVQQDVIQIQTKKSAWVGSRKLSKKTLSLPPDIANDSSARAHGKSALEVGLTLLLIRNPKVIARRQWALRFGQVFPVFTAIVAIFALLVAKLKVGWLLAVIAASLGSASCAQILTLIANLQAASLATTILDRKHIYPHSHDEKAVITATKAWAWHGIIPGIFSKLM